MNDNSTYKGPGDLIQAAIFSNKNYYDQELWFQLLWDDEIGFSEQDDSNWPKNPKKKKSGHITNCSSTAFQEIVQPCPKDL